MQKRLDNGTILRYCFVSLSNNPVRRFCPCVIHRSAVRINHMPAEPIIVLGANAHLTAWLRR